VRILFLTHRLPYAPNRGDRIRAYHLLRLLALHHEVHLVSLLHDRDEAARVGELEGMAASVEGVRTGGMRRFMSAALALPGATPLTHVLLDGPEIDRVIQRRVALTKPDVVVAYCSGMARFALEPPLADLPFVLDMVDVDSEKWAALGRQLGRLRGWVYRREARRLGDFERRVMGRASATVVSSDRERTLLDAAVPAHHAVTVMNGVDVHGFAPRDAPTEEPRVIFCGVFNYQPNEAGALWFAREVWPLVRRLHPRARLALVGMNPTRSVRALASESITVTGAVKDVRPHLWQSALSVAPLHLARGVQNKVLEAIAAGLPCVVTPDVFEGLPAAVRPACVSVKAPEAFAGAIVQWLNLDGASRRTIAERATLDGLSWDRQLQPFLDLIEQAAGTRQVVSDVTAGREAERAAVRA
jgi:sugar transferase (PEP-CTERM/EpsH1 system associated)